MSSGRFSEFHCTKPVLEPDPRAVVADAPETKGGVTIKYYAAQYAAGAGEKVAAYAVSPDGTFEAGKSNPDVQATGEKLIRACRTGFDP
jgi:hypothetical protein